MTTDDEDLPVLTQVLRTGGGWLPQPAHDDGDGEPAWPRALVIGSDPEPHHEDGHESGGRSSSHVPAVFRNGHANAKTSGAGAFFDAVASDADPRRIDLHDNDVFARTSPTDAGFGGLLDEPPLVVRHDDAELANAGDAGAAASARSSTPVPVSLGAISRDVPLVFRPASSTGAPNFDAAFALRVRDSVLRELSGRIDTELDARIAQTLHAELEAALARVQASLRIALAEAMRDVVGHAVDDAIRRLGAAAPLDDTR